MSCLVLTGKWWPVALECFLYLVCCVVLAVWGRLGSSGLWEDTGSTGADGTGSALAQLHLHHATTLAQTVISPLTIHYRMNILYIGIMHCRSRVYFSSLSLCLEHFSGSIFVTTNKQ